MSINTKELITFKIVPPKANRPPYLVLRLWCFYRLASFAIFLNRVFGCSIVRFPKANETGGGSEIITSIPPEIQTEVILKQSERTWEWLKDEIAHTIEDCSSEDGQRAFRLLDALAKHFRYRLLNNRSEPCALSFTISEQNHDVMAKLRHLIEILQKAELLYIRSGPAKEEGQRETYYVPNKILWPIRGLDPYGQHARVSIRASVLWNAAKQGTIEPTQGRRQTNGPMG